MAPAWTRAYLGLPLGTQDRQGKAVLAAVWLAVLVLAGVLAARAPLVWKLPFVLAAFWAWSQFVHRSVEWAWDAQIPTPVGWILFCGAVGLALTGAYVVSRNDGRFPEAYAAHVVAVGFLSACLPWLAWETWSARRRQL